MSKAGQRLIAAAREARDAVLAQMCARDWHDWQFYGDGIMQDISGLMVASGRQKCARCGRKRVKSFVVGRRPTAPTSQEQEP